MLATKHPGSDGLKEADGSLIRLWRRLKDQIVGDVPEDIALCEYDCRKQQCSMDEWATCDRRLRRAAGELMPPRPEAIAGDPKRDSLRGFQAAAKAHADAVRQFLVARETASRQEREELIDAIKRTRAKTESAVEALGSFSSPREAAPS